jgi:hypothetical protein
MSRRLQFSLRGILAVVLAICLMLAAIRWLPVVGPAKLFAAGLVVALMVDIATERRRWQ